MHPLLSSPKLLPHAARARGARGFFKRFPCRFDLLEGKLIPEPGTFFYQGELVKVESRWGTFWQADFSNFVTPGSYQIEIDYQISAPFMIDDWVYDRLTRGFLTFLNAQRAQFVRSPPRHVHALGMSQHAFSFMALFGHL